MVGSRDHLLRTNAAYERHAGDYLAREDDRAWLAPLIERFRSLLDGRSVLDLGCGPGREAVELAAAGLSVVGLDMTDAFLRIAAERHPVGGYVRGDMLHLPFSAGLFDGVLASASLLHCTPEEVGTALAEVRRVLRPGGIFYSSMQIGGHAGIAEPGAHEAVRLARYYALYEPATWQEELERAGFTVARLDANEFEPSVAACHCNHGARGWLMAYARRTV